MSETSLPVVFLMGATATGKTAIAIAAVGRLPVEVVSVDSALVYRGMDIGTGKPSAQEQAVCPHRLIDIRDPAESYSAAEFRADALAAIAEIHAAGRVPLLVGGTGLYFRALREGLATLPAADEAVRERIESEARERGWASLHAELARVDAAAARRIHPNDPQRIQRALEVYRITGRPLSAHQQAGRGEPFAHRVLSLVLEPVEREPLHRRIERRFHAMLAGGFEAEVAALRARGDLRADLPSMRAVGYRQMWRYLAGECDHASMVERAVTATRQLAKRQMTWLRRERVSARFDSESLDVRERVLDAIERELAGG